MKLLGLRVVKNVCKNKLTEVKKMKYIMSILDGDFLASRRQIMKKTSVLITSLCALGAAVAMAAEPVSSVNAVGYYNVTLPPNGKFIMMGSPFDPTGSDTNTQRTLQDIFGSNSGLRKSSSKSLVDRVYVWDIPSQTYLILGQNATNDLFARVKDNTTWSHPTNPVVPRGYAFFIQSVSSETNASTITLAGQVPYALTNALPIVGDPGSSPFQMVMNPYPVDTTLDSLINTNHGAVADSSKSLCDRIWIWDTAKQTYGILGLKAPSNRWFYCSNNGLWSSNIPPIVVKAGEGFWYIGKTNFTWNSDKTYTWP